MPRFSLALSLLALVVGCGAAQTPQSANRTIRDYFPSAMDTIWSFDIDAGVGEPPVLGSLSVTEVDGNAFVLSNNGEERPKRYEWREGDLYHVDADGWLLRGPIAVGTEWAAPGGRRGRITSIDARSETNAGNFSGCVVVEERGGADGREITTTYCPDVGMAEQVVILAQDGIRAQVTISLRAFILGE